MADLQQIIGAILRDLAKARFASDLYSRSIARYYEGDFLLRKFPVPRADISEVEIDLKFSITDVGDISVNAEGREANVAFLLERTVEQLVATYLDEARNVTRDDSNVENQLRELMAKGFNSTALRIQLRQNILRYFIESYTHLISANGEFDVPAALEGLRQPMFWAHETYLNKATVETPEQLKELRQRLDAPFNQIFDKVRASQGFRNVVQSLVEPIRNLWQAHHDAQLGIEVNGHVLAQLQQAAISSIRIKAEVRNSMWTEVKVGEHRYERSLTPE